MQPEGRYGNPSARQAEIAVSVGGVVVFGRIEGVVALTGKRFGTNAIWVWRVRDEKATSMRATSLGEAPPS